MTTDQTSEAVKAPLSVLLPFRNGASTLDECVDSIQSQTWRDFELLAVNDHSSDESLTVLRSRARSDPRIRVLQNPGRGLVAALNHGLQKAEGDLVARMDADDRMHPERLLKQLRYLRQNPDIAAVGSRARLFPENAIRSGFREYMRWQNACLRPEEIARDIYIEAPLIHPTVMYRRAAVLDLGGYRDGPFPEDYDLWLRFHHSGLRMAKLDVSLLEWREDPERTSRVDPRYDREAFDGLRAHYLAKDSRLRSRRHNFVFWGAGRRTRQRCRHLQNKGFTPRAWVDIDPCKIGNRLQGVPVVPPEWLRSNRTFVLCYVTNHGARELITHQLLEYGYLAGRDFLMVG